jgi:alpha-tubulin suppressor-like RCC1 family protein
MHTSLLIDSIVRQTTVLIAHLSTAAGIRAPLAHVADEVAEASTDFTQLSGGYEHTCALRSDGSLTCWGRDLHGEVSGPNAASSADFTEVAAGGHHTCALRTDGSLACWGSEEFTDEVSGPNAYVGTGFTHVMAAFEQTCGLHENGSLRCWGADSEGQVSGPNASRMGRIVGFVQLSGSLEADGNHVCALAGDGTVACWGNDDHDQLSGLDVLATRPH